MKRKPFAPAEITSSVLKGIGLEKDHFLLLANHFRKRISIKYSLQVESQSDLSDITQLLQFAKSRKKGEIKAKISTYTHPQTNNMFVLQTCMADQRFIIDTIRLCIEEKKLKEVGSVHFTSPVQRNHDGMLLAAAEKEDEDHHLESFTHFLLSGFESEAEAKSFEETILNHLEMAYDSVKNYAEIRSQLIETVNSYHSFSSRTDSIAEAHDTLAWLMEDNFLFLSLAKLRSRSGEVEIVRGSELGVTLNQVADLTLVKKISSRLFTAQYKKALLLVKSTTLSPVKNTGITSLVFLCEYNENQELKGVKVLVGMFTRKALTHQRSSIPLLKSRLQRILKQDDARPLSSTWNKRVKAFNSIKLDYLFECDDTQLRQLIDKRLDMESGEDATAHLDFQSEKNSAYLILGIPKNSFSDDLVDTIELKIKEATGASHAELEIEGVKGQIVPLAFYLTGSLKTDKSMTTKAEQEIIELATPWSTTFRNVMSESGMSNWNQLYNKYVEAFPPAYESVTTGSESVADVLLLESAIQKNSIQFDFVEGPADMVRLKMYRSADQHLLLSEILPILHNFGLRVLNEIPTTVKLPDNTCLHLDTFRLMVDDKAGEVNFVKDKTRLVEGLTAIFSNKIPSDSLNRLMLRPGLTWMDVDVIRSYVRYSLQIGPFFDSAIVDKILYRHAVITSGLMDYFHAKFNPALEVKKGIRSAAVEQKKAAFMSLMEKINDATEDRVLRVFFNLMESTVRTNAFKKERPFHYLSFKIDCAKLERCPEPRPVFEIFVHHAEMEGCHLRSGLVARGGLRWSDRLDDYRTEIFGLMRAQKTKNVLIVPQGAKGGFIVKGNPRPGQDRKAYGDEMYKILIRGMLDVTDNRAAGKEVRPAGVVCHDEFDPYLVVAADKGTAHLSDTANALSAEYGFWLGDAFASGGSVGYDHKVEGITAKGAWVCIRHHFDKLGMDPEKDVIRVVGIGDMSGDVFGNGMLRSKTIKLVGAFNHAHVFLDPNPDIAKSYEERSRMFKLPRSGWNDYDKKSISKGGGVFSRAEKSIPLTPETQALLNTNEKSLPTEEVIKRLLTLDVDLLYNGGLGTYIKSSKEDHREVGDKTNDAVRVDGADVRAKVVGEGGNLGATQKGRIEFAMKGGLIDTDAIDNSGGVDCSDREVNLKILFGPMMAKGKMKYEQRNKVLKEATNEVLDKILQDNFGHALCLSLDEIRSKKDPYLFLWTSEFLKEKGLMSPAQEDLPTLTELQQRGIKNGLTRPELSKLMAFFKLYTKGELLSLSAEKFPLREEFLEHYFPAKVFKTYKQDISNHMLLKEILATVWIGNIINNAGPSLFTDLISDTERSVLDIAYAYTACERWFNAHELKKQILENKQVALSHRLSALVDVEQMIKVSASWALHFLAGKSLYEKIGDGQNFKAESVKYTKALGDIIKGIQQDPSAATQLKSYTDKFISQGFSKDISSKIASATHWAKVLPVVFVAEKNKRSTADTANAYLRCGIATGMQNILSKISVQSSVDKFEAQALKSLFASLRRTNLMLTEKALKTGVEQALKKEPALTEIGNEVAKLQVSSTDAVPISLLVVMAEKLHKAVARL